MLNAIEASTISIVGAFINGWVYALLRRREVRMPGE